ncbi:hypothetical protein ABJI51_17995 [Amycolatopsis sp. NEAU-NG30]|uniref:Uncharacterized protein n=1 Tax=Amycolatopsis melonis TaxID=3156488 RepID=A0ABV0LFB4_9PSEU
MSQVEVFQFVLTIVTDTGNTVRVGVLIMMLAALLFVCLLGILQVPGVAAALGGWLLGGGAVGRTVMQRKRGGRARRGRVGK